MKPFLRNTEKRILTILNFRQPFLYLSILSYLLLLSGCEEPTYPADQVIQSVKKLCKDEYNLDVEGRIVGTTLGISIPIEGLVDEELKLAKEAAEKIENLALSMRRVMLSTDRPLDFYILCARDTEMIGAEYVMVGNTMNIKRVLLLDISRGQYLNRLQRDFKLNPAILGEHKVKSLFEDLNKKISPELTLLEYAHFPISTQKVQEIFYPTILIAEPRSIDYQIIDIQTKEISDSEALSWVKTKETYTPRPNAQRGASIFPPGFDNEYLILVNRANPARPIAEILPKFFPKENEIQQRSMDGIFAKYEDLTKVDSEGLPLKEIKLTTFLANQAARRLKERLGYQEPFKGNFKIVFVAAGFEDDIFRLDFNIEGEEKEIFAQALAIFGNITHEHWFEDFAGIEITSQISGTKISISKQELDLLCRRKIDIDEIMKKLD